jgi:hypothetical protein
MRTHVYTGLDPLVFVELGMHILGESIPDQIQNVIIDNEYSQI